MISTGAAGCASALYFGRTWPGTSLFLFVLLGRLFDWPWTGTAGTFLYGLSLGLLCVLLAWRGDDYLDVAGKAAVDLQAGWKDLFAGYLEPYRDFEYVPVTILPPEREAPVVVLPGGLRAFLPPLGEILAYWVRRPAGSNAAGPRARLPPGPRAYPLATYSNYVFLPFDPAVATAQQRFQMFHEIGHALYARSFPAIGRVQTWPNLLLLTCGTFALTWLTPAPALLIGAMLALWQSVTLLRAVPSFDRNRYSELCADYFALLHMRGDLETRPFLERLIENLRAAPDPLHHLRAWELEQLLSALMPDPAEAGSEPSTIAIEQASKVQRRLVLMGSEHPLLLGVALTACLAVAGLLLRRQAPETLLLFAGLYFLLPYLAWRFGSGRRSAIEHGRVAHFLRERSADGGEREAIRLSFS